MANPLSILFHDFRYRMKYGALAPLKNRTLYLPPRSISQSIDSESSGFQTAVLGPQVEQSASQKSARQARKRLRSNANVVVSNDFDLFTRPAEQDKTISRILEMLAAGQTWEEAGFHDWMMSEIERNGSQDGCKTQQDVVQRYEQLDTLAEHLRSGAPLRKPTGTFGRYGPIDGVVVAIGRNGDAIFCGSGKHRLALAIGLDAPVLPVSVCAVHRLAVENGAWNKRAQESVRLKQRQNR